MYLERKRLSLLLLLKAPFLLSVWVLERLLTASVTWLSLCVFFSPSVFHLDAEFREPRVIELWEAAKRANLSKDELDSLKVILYIAHRHHQTCASTDLSPAALPVKENS